MPRRRSGGPPPNPFEPLEGAVADTLDLHGLDAASAEGAVTDFLRRVHRRTPGALVHIITGRGRGSVGAPVLKRSIRTLLKTNPPGLPIADWGNDLDGGGYLVRLKR
jgi:DNA-nicking Smr family endonuclease